MTSRIPVFHQSAMFSRCLSSERRHQSNMDAELTHSRASHQERRRRRGREGRRRRHDRRRPTPANAGAEDNRDSPERGARERRSLDRYGPRETTHHADQDQRPRSRSRSRSRPRLHTRSRSRSRSRSRPRPERRMETENNTADQAETGAEQLNGQSNGRLRENSNGGRSRSWPRGSSGGGGGDGGRRSRGGPRRSKVSVPDNWDDVPKIGGVIGTSRFVAMRVPLDDKFTRMIRSPDELWTPEIFLETQGKGGQDVRLLVDLTNTTKYYDGEAAFRESGVKYAKLRIEGFKAPPRETEVAEFVRIVDEFVAAEPTGLIAVHCTHGLNRTGYLVVSYLVQRGGLSVQDALKAFSDARPPGLIKHMYVEELYRRYAPEATVELPELPPWAAAKYGARSR